MHRQAKVSPILVTGAPRSGTTFLGKMLSLSRGTSYVYEPFSAVHGLEGVPEPYLYASPDSPFEGHAHQLTESLLSGHARFRRSPDSAETHSLARIAKGFAKSSTNVRYKRDSWDPRRQRWLIKDPCAALSAGWLAQHYDFTVVVCVRHPVSTIASYRRLAWTFPIGEVCAIPGLAAALSFQINVNAESVVESGAYLWRIFYEVLLHAAAANDRIIIVKHEDLSRDPLPVISALYQQLGLNLTPRVERKIDSFTGRQNKVMASGEMVHEIKRDSRGIAEEDRLKWFTDNEIARIRTIVEPISESWYGRDTWTGSNR